MPITHATKVGIIGEPQWNEEHDLSNFFPSEIGAVAGSGVTGRLAQFADPETLQAANLIPPAANILTLTNAAAATLALNITAGKTLTLTAADNYTLTIPATGTAALLGTAQTFTAAQKINVNSTTALFVEQDGVKDNVFQVDTTNGLVFMGGGSAATSVTSANNAIFKSGWQIGLTTDSFYVAAGTNTWNAFGAAAYYFSAATVGGTFGFRTGGIGAAQVRMGITATGVYIGSNYGSSRLHVTGEDNRTQLQVSGFTTQTNPVVYFFDNTAATNVVRNVLKLETQSTGTAANGLGAGLLFSIETATAGTMQSAGRVYSVAIDNTNATRKYALVGTAYDTVEREGWRVEASGTEPKIGFYGVAPIARAVLATGTGASVDDVITALQNLGLVKQS